VGRSVGSTLEIGIRGSWNSRNPEIGGTAEIGKRGSWNRRDLKRPELGNSEFEGPGIHGTPKSKEPRNSEFEVPQFQPSEGEVFNRSRVEIALFLPVFRAREQRGRAGGSDYGMGSLAPVAIGGSL